MSRRRLNTRRLESRRPAFDLLEARRLPATIVWDGAGDGTSFDDPKNWMGGVAPGSADTAEITVGSNVTITLPASTTVSSAVSSDLL